MRKLLLAALAAALLSTQAFAWFSGPTTAPTTGKLIPPTHEYEIDTWGSNSEVYEFTPRSNPNMTCVVFLNDAITAVSMQCFPQPIKAK